MAKSCHCKEAECEECPEWIFTFADLVMLMMGFFVILWVLKPSANPEKRPDGEVLPVELVAKIREAFDYLPDPNSKDPVDMYMLLKKLETLPPLKGPGDGGKTKLERKGAEGTDPETQMLRPGELSVIGTKILFEKGDPKLSPEAKRTLNSIGDILKGHRVIVQVKGHVSVDDLLESATSQAKMDLSVKRAQAVAEYLMTLGVSPDVLRVQGCSTFEPIAERVYSGDTLAQNRRVEVEATNMLVPERQDSRKPKAAALKVPNAEPTASIKDEKE